MYDMIPVIHGYVRLAKKVWFHPYDMTPNIYGYIRNNEKR